MKIVTDTNIWYKLSNEPILFEKVKDLPLAPNYVNIYELCTSFNLVHMQDQTREVVRKMFYFKKNVLLVPQLIYLAKLNGEYNYDYSEIESYLTFSELFAKGSEIKEEEMSAFKEWLKSVEDNLKKVTDFSNKEAKDIEARITDTKTHKKKDTTNLILNFINKLVEAATSGEVTLKEFDFRQIELMVNAVDYYFKALETTPMKMQPNDWYDFSILAYVKPGDKFWTYDGRWLQIIKDAKMENYLFNP